MVSHPLCSQLAEQYGNDVASEVLGRSRSDLQLNAMPTVPYSSNVSSAGSTYGGSKYEGIPKGAEGGYAQ